MNNLIDTFLTKVENIASRPSRAMAIADAILDRVTKKDSASAAPFYEYQYTPCTPITGCPSGRVKNKIKRRLCQCSYAGCCGPWEPASGNVCC